MVEDWTIVYTPSSPTSSSSTTPTASPFSSPMLDVSHLPLPVQHAHYAYPTTRATTTSSNAVMGGSKRPTISRRNSPSDGSNHVLSLVRAHEPIDIPVPPSLKAKAKGLRSKSASSSSSFEGRATNSINNGLLSSSSYSPSQGTNAVWYDYDEFGHAGRAVFVSDLSPSPSTSPSFIPCSIQSSSPADWRDDHHMLGCLPTGPSPTPLLPPSPLLYPSNMEFPTQKYTSPPPLALPKPVLRPSKTWA